MNLQSILFLNRKEQPSYYLNHNHKMILFNSLHVDLYSTRDFLVQMQSYTLFITKLDWSTKHTSLTNKEVNYLWEINMWRLIQKCYGSLCRN